MNHFHCLDESVYKHNTAAWNNICYALIKTEQAAMKDRQGNPDGE